MSRRGIRIIPKAKDPLGPLIKLSMARNWHLKGAVGRDRSTRESGEYTYLVPETDTYVILRDDALTGTHYFTVWGPGEGELAKEIRAMWESYGEADLLSWWDRAVESNDVDDKVDAILFMGVGAPSAPNDEFAQRIRAALRDEDKDVRNAAIVAAGYADWPAVFRPDLESCLKSDPDSTARQRAQVVLDRWEKDLGETS